MQFKWLSSTGAELFRAGELEIAVKLIHLEMWMGSDLRSLASLT